MCCGNSFGKKLIVFSLTFALGVLAGNFFVSNQLPADLPAPEIAINTFTIKPIEQENPVDCLAKYKKREPETDDFNSRSSLEREIRLLREAIEAEKWLENNKNAPLPQKEYYQKKLDTTYKKLFPENEEKRRFYEHEKRATTTLLYLEKCYEF